MEAITIIDGLISKRGFQMSAKTDLVLDLTVEDNGDQFVDHYFADHELRIVVFAHEFPSDCIPHWFELKGVNSGTHLRMSSLPQVVKRHFFTSLIHDAGHALEMQYW
jgi:hypothetical protein